MTMRVRRQTRLWSYRPLNQAAITLSMTDEQALDRLGRLPAGFELIPLFPVTDLTEVSEDA
jgi:hypothetical protein